MAFFLYNTLIQFERRMNMKNRSYVYLFAFAALLLIVGLACSVLGGSTPAPQQPVQTSAPVSSENSSSSAGSNASDTSSSSGLVTFADENNYYKIEVPGNWKHSQTRDNDKNYYYIDTFTSPDGNAVIENIAYNDGTAFQGSDEAKFGLYLLNTFYSKTGKEGDIRVTEEKQQSDGSDRLTWYSKAGGYSGISFLEVRNHYTFLMFTIDWGNDYKDQYIDILNNVVASYKIP